jgi:hypothetical protein
MIRAGGREQAPMKDELGTIMADAASEAVAWMTGDRAMLDSSDRIREQMREYGRQQPSIVNVNIARDVAADANVRADESNPSTVVTVNGAPQ